MDFDMSLTLQTYQCGFDMLNADEWGQVYWSAYKYANNGATPSSEIYGNGATPQLQDYIGLNGAKVHAVDTDWRDVVYRTALMQNYSATLSKGSDNGAFSLALNYLDHDGLVENTNFQRINTRISSNYHYLDNRLRIGENVAINRWTQTLSPAGVDENAINSILPRRFMMRMAIITMPSMMFWVMLPIWHVCWRMKNRTNMITGVSSVMHSLKLNRLRTWC